MTFKAKHPSESTKCSSSELASLTLQGIEAHSSKTWTEQMTIPNSLMFSNLKHCGIITDNYELKVISIIITPIIRQLFINIINFFFYR